MITFLAARHAKVAGIEVIPLTDAWAQRPFSIFCRARRALPKHAAAFVAPLLQTAKT